MRNKFKLWCVLIAVIGLILVCCGCSAKKKDDSETSNVVEEKTVKTDYYNLLQDVKLENQQQEDGSTVICVTTKHFVLKIPLLEDGKSHWQWELSDEGKKLTFYCSDCKEDLEYGYNEGIGEIASLIVFDKNDTSYIDNDFPGYHDIGYSSDKKIVMKTPTDYRGTQNTDKIFSEMCKKVRESIHNIEIIDNK